MAIINNASQEIVCKIVYYGPALGGKTSNLKCIHSLLPKERKGELLSLATQQDRTLFFDFMPLDLGEIRGFKTKFALYTVPGQVFYNATRRLVLRGVDGIVFVADSQRERLDENIDSLENMCENVASYGYDIEEIPWIIQYNKRDLHDILSVEELHRKLNFWNVPEFESVAITGQGIKESLKRISALVLDSIETMTRARVPEGLASEKVSVDASQETEDPSLSVHAAPVSVAEVSQQKIRTPEISESKPIKKPAALSIPKINLRQVGAIFWRGMSVGKGRVSLETRLTQDTNADYHLIAECKIFYLFPFRSTTIIKYERTISVNIEGKPERFYLFRRIYNGTGKERQPNIVLWVKEGGLHPPLYTKYETNLGSFYFVPERDEMFFKYLV